MFDVKLLARIVKARVLPPPPDLKVSEWVESARRLPAGSAEPGMMKLSRTPYTREILDAVCDPAIETVVWQASAQVSKSETALSIVLYFLVQDPSPTMFVMPSSGVAEAFSKERIASAISLTEGLSTLVDLKSRSSDQTILYKPFPNGASLVMAGAESPSQLSSRPRRVIVCDEISKYPASAGSEGDPVSLALKRSTTFVGRRKHVLISTPSVKGECRINAAYLESDQRKFYVPCPHCQEMQVLIWSQVQWPTGHPEQAQYQCRGCQELIPNHEKTWMLANGEWRAHTTAKSPGVCGFHISELYSPWSSWGHMAEEFVVKSEQGSEIFQTFVNSSLGEVFDPAYGTEAKADGLLGRARACRLPKGVVPNEAGFLVASSDTQDDRIECLIQAVLPGGKIHTVCHHIIDGNLALVEPWDRLETFVKQPWKREDGKTMRVKKMCLDTGGHYSAEVTKFCKRRSLLGIVVPIKGSSYPIVGVVKQSKKRSKLWLVDTVALKDTMFADLRVETVGAPGHQSFYNNIEPDFFTQLLSERKVKSAKGRRYEVFPKGSRNEACDMYAYCRAAIRIFNPLPGETERFAKHYQEATPAPLEPKVTVENIPRPATDLRIEGPGEVDLEFTYEEPAPEPPPITPEPSRVNSTRRPTIQRMPRIPKRILGW